MTLFPLPPIPHPLPRNVGWENIPIHDDGAPLVPVGAFSDYCAGRVFSENIYAGETVHAPYADGALNGALFANFLRAPIAEKLLAIGRALPDDLFLLVLDGYRPLGVQQALWDDLYAQYAARGLSADDCYTATRGFLAKPSADPSRPAPHTTGAVVDLTIVQLQPHEAAHVAYLTDLLRDAALSDVIKTAIEWVRLSLIRTRGVALPMGSSFDELCPQAACAWHETQENDSIYANNRRFLYHHMIAQGFAVLHSEWWHYDCDTQATAIKRGGDVARYGYCEPDAGNMQFEQHMRDMAAQHKDVWRGVRGMARDDLRALGVTDDAWIARLLPFAIEPIANNVTACRIIAGE